MTQALLAILSAGAGVTVAHGQEAGASPGVPQQQFVAPLDLTATRADAVLAREFSGTLSPETGSVSFLLSDVEIRGTTSYPLDELRQPWEALIGESVTVAQVYDLTNALRNRYRNDGYLLAQVVTQVEPTTGAVTADVVEGAVADVSFRGELRGRQRILRNIGREISSVAPTTMQNLERQLLLINDLPGVTAYSVPEGPELLAATMLAIEMDHKPVDFEFGVRNRASELLGPEQYDMRLDFNSLFRAYESTTIHAVSSGDDRLEYGALTHSEVLGHRGKQFTFAIASSDSVPELGTDFAQFNLTTNNDMANIGLRFPLRRSRESNITLRTRVTWQDSLTDETGFAITHDVISAFRLGLTADRVANWFRAPGVNMLDFEVSQGLSAFDASLLGDPLASRLGGDPEFAKITLYAAHLQSIGRRWSMLLALNGQYAFDNVLAPEEFAYGGEFFGRAYDPSEFVGDHGLAAKFEVRLTVGGDAFGTTVYMFADGGEVRQEFGPGKEGSKPERQSATAAGLGVRFRLGRHMAGYVEVAQPSDPVAAEGTDDARVFGGISVTF